MSDKTVNFKAELRKAQQRVSVLESESRDSAELKKEIARLRSELKQERSKKPVVDNREVVRLRALLKESQQEKRDLVKHYESCTKWRERKWRT